MDATADGVDGEPSVTKAVLGIRLRPGLVADSASPVSVETGGLPRRPSGREVTVVADDPPSRCRERPRPPPPDRPLRRVTAEVTPAVPFTAGVDGGDPRSEETRVELGIAALGGAPRPFRGVTGVTEAPPIRTDPAQRGVEIGVSSSASQGSLHAVAEAPLRLAHGEGRAWLSDAPVVDSRAPPCLGESGTEAGGGHSQEPKATQTNVRYS